MIEEHDRAKMEALRLCDERVPTAIIALQNLIDAAEREASPPAQRADAE